MEKPITQQQRDRAAKSTERVVALANRFANDSKAPIQMSFFSEDEREEGKCNPELPEMITATIVVGNGQEIEISSFPDINEKLYFKLWNLTNAPYYGQNVEVSTQDETLLESLIRQILDHYVSKTTLENGAKSQQQQAEIERLKDGKW